MTNTRDRITLGTTPLIGMLVCLTVVVVLTLTCELVYGGGTFGLVAMGVLSLIVVCMPIVAKKRIEPFEPIVLFAFSIFMGCTLRSIAVAFSPADNYKIDFLTDGMPLAVIFRNAIWVPIALALFSLGYHLTRKRVPIERLRIMKRDSWRFGRLRIAVLILTVGSLVATVQLARVTEVDLTDLARLSTKRGIPIETRYGTRYASLGYLRWCAEGANVALLFVYTYWRTKRKRARALFALNRSRYGVLLTLLTGLSMAWPIMSSERSAILEILFSLAVVATYLRGRGDRAARRRFVRLALVGATIAVAVLVSVGAWRQYSQLGQFQDESPAQALINNTVNSGNFLCLIRTALIIDRMPRVADWFYGESYANLLVAPVPRSLWADKPEIDLGLFVARELYGHPIYTNGYPPGLIGEAYINFGIPGLLVIPFLVGAVLKVTFNSFRPLLGTNTNATLLYAVILWPVAFQAAELSFAQTVINFLLSLVSTCLVLRFVTVSQHAMHERFAMHAEMNVGASPARVGHGW